MNGYLLYFAYGANLNHKAMSRRCPNAIYAGRATLQDHKLVFRGVADVERHTGSVVDGALWYLTASCIRVLDRFEGYPWLYRRYLVPVMFGGHKVYAMVYKMTRRRGLGAPSEPYLTTIAQGYADCGLTAERLLRAVIDADREPKSKTWSYVKRSERVRAKPVCVA